MGRWAQAKRRGTSAGPGLWFGGLGLTFNGTHLYAIWGNYRAPDLYKIFFRDLTLGTPVEFDDISGELEEYTTTYDWVAGHEYLVQLIAFVGGFSVQADAATWTAP